MLKTVSSPFPHFEHMYQMSLHRDHYNFSLIPSLKTESLQKCCLSHRTVCRIACCQIKLHTALVNLISNLKAEPQPAKMHVAVGWKLQQNRSHFKRSTIMQIFLFPFWIRGKPDCLRDLPLPIKARTALPRVSTSQDCETRLLQRPCVRELPTG